MLDDLILPERLAVLAGAAAFKRGEAYFRDGRVELFVDEPERADGTVTGSGTEPYAVSLEAMGSELAWECTCPVGDRGEFCKHAVALALARRADRDPPTAPSDTPTVSADRRGRRGKEAELRSFLEGQDHARLVEWLLEAARGDRTTRDTLLMAARAGGPSGVLRKLISEVIQARGFVDYSEMPGFARRVDALIDTLAKRNGAELMALAEHAMDRLGRILEACDDSDGYMSELFARLVELHIRASEEAKPDPTAFAAWLFDRQMHDEWGLWPGPEAYRGVLGETGLAEYERQARVVWDKLPARLPGQAAGREDHYRISRLMESQAMLMGDHQALVAVIAKDLSHSHAFLRIAEVLRDAGDHDAAMDWAERGLKAFPVGVDSRLEDFLIDEYFRRKRVADAMALAWRQYSQATGEWSYQQFARRARRASDHEAWLARARDALKQEALRQHARFNPLFGERPARPNLTSLIRVLLSERDLDGALSEAESGACEALTLIELADALASTRPDAAVPLYKRAVEPLVEMRKNDAYSAAAKAMGKTRALLNKLGRGSEFGDWLAEVRLAHKPKRNFMKLLDGL